MSLGHTDDTAPAAAHAGLGTQDCRKISAVLARVGDKWRIQIVVLLGHGPRRFNEIKRMVGGISQRMLTLTLRGLERDGLVLRTAYPTVPARVDYALTELGGSLRCAVESLSSWARLHQDDIEAAQLLFDSRPDAGPNGVSRAAVPDRAPQPLRPAPTTGTGRSPSAASG